MRSSRTGDSGASLPARDSKGSRASTTANLTRTQAARRDTPGGASRRAHPAREPAMAPSRHHAGIFSPSVTGSPARSREGGSTRRPPGAPGLHPCRSRATGGSTVARQRPQERRDQMPDVVEPALWAGVEVKILAMPRVHQPRDAFGLRLRKVALLRPALPIDDHGRSLPALPAPGSRLLASPQVIGGRAECGPGS